jgi:maltose/maltodextrin transport system substrate-binding protein
MKKLFAFCLWFGFSAALLAFQDGELLIWMDGDRAAALRPFADEFKEQFGIRVTIQSPEKLTDNFQTAAQSWKGPDIIVWAHDKVGEWADAGIAAPIDASEDFRSRFLSQAWEAVTHQNQHWGYPIGLEAVTLIYNRKLLTGPPPTQLSELFDIDARIKKEHPGVHTILWDYRSPYYSWGILASAGAYTFAKANGRWDLSDSGVATSGAVEAVTEISNLVCQGVVPKGTSYSVSEDLMSKGKAAMMISGPWSWSNLRKGGIDFSVSPVPGVNGQPGRPFVGVFCAYINRGTPNKDIAKEFLERVFFKVEAQRAMNQAKPIGVPALKEYYEEVAKDNELVRELKKAVELGEVMPNLPQMGRFFSSLETALQVATNNQATPCQALEEARATLVQPRPAERRP